MIDPQLPLTPILTTNTINYDWIITAAEVADVDGHHDVVRTVHYQMRGRQLKTADGTDVYSATVEGQLDLTYNPNKFTAYADLTQAQMVNWVAASLDREHQQAMRNQIATDILNQKLPKQSKSLPWQA